MKRFLIIMLLLSVKSYSQDFIGKWKVISYEDEIVYYNKITDSISCKDEENKVKAAQFREMFEQLLFTVTYQFDENGKCIMDFPATGDTMVGTYEIDREKKKILIKNSGEENDEMPYTFEAGILFLEMKMEIGYLKIGLKKE